MNTILAWILGILAILGIIAWFFAASLPTEQTTKAAPIVGGAYLIHKYMKHKKSHKKRK